MLQVSRFFNRLTGALALAAAALALAGCVTSTSSLDLLDSTTPTGSPFTQALFRNYALVAKSFNIAPNSDDLDIFGDSGGGAIQTLAEAFATKALIAAKGTEVDPEPSYDDDSAHARDRLLRALGVGKDRFPNDAARAQVEFDCWMLNMTVGSQQGAAIQCRSGFDAAINRLERDINPPQIAMPAPASANYTVYFNFNSWTLTGEQLTVLQQAIATARAGGQSHITIVGHTDTVGSDAYNLRLSTKRANVVAETLVDMGARRDAIQVSGVGKADLAVQTPNGVREPKNRRSVVTLLP
jgi:outer membrane protein OmpA-like peptidoglycan-associated protein